MDPIRSCIVCRNKKSKKELFKIVSKDKKAVYDKNQKINSRSIYICKSHECINKCKKIVSDLSTYAGVLQSNNKIFVIKPINRAIFLSRKFS